MGTGPAPAEHYEIAAKLRAAVAPLSRLLRQHSGSHLTPTQYTLLGSVMRHGPISISDLAAREQLSAPVVSKAVAAMEDADLVERIKVPEDRRVCQIQLSEHGYEWLDESRTRRDTWLAERLAALAPDELAAVVGALPALEHLVQEPGTGDAPAADAARRGIDTRPDSAPPRDRPTQSARATTTDEPATARSS